MNQTQINTPETLTPRQLTRAIVESVVSRHQGVTIDDVFGPCRQRRVINARFEAIAEIVETRPHWSYPTIGRLFNRDHTTIMAALDRIGARKPRARWSDYHQVMDAVRSVSKFIVDYEAVADQQEYLAALSVASFLRNFALPVWARDVEGPNHG